jgi:hypothetical protein
MLKSPTINYKYLFKMKRNILLYLLLFSLLVNVFQYVNSKSIIDKYEKDINKFKTKIENLETKETTDLNLKNSK